MGRCVSRVGITRPTRLPPHRCSLNPHHTFPQPTLTTHIYTPTYPHPHRDWNIGAPKSTCASEAAARINPDLKLRALQNRVSPETGK